MNTTNQSSHSSREEYDQLGKLAVPAEALYGINTLRGVANLTVSPNTINNEPAFVRAFAHCKWAAALANSEQGLLSDAQRDAIAQACKELAEGLHGEFLKVDFMEGSGGTSTNMNFNEVIANRAQQILGGELGRYDQVHPNDHVNRSQSTNDVYPSAMKIAARELLAELIPELTQLAESLAVKSKEFGSILHLGRTCMQDAQPMTLGQLFGGYSALVARLSNQMSTARDYLLTLPLGGTAIGTGFGSDPGYKQKVYGHLSSLTSTAFVPATDPFDAMQNLDVFCRISGELRTAATSIAKIGSDLIVLSSGPNGGLGEVELPAVQAGSSIMPGKVNPVVPMSMVQIGFAVVGNDVCIAQANQAGQLEINHFEPVVADRLYDSIRLLRNGVKLFREKCVDGIEANSSVNETHLMASSAIATALIPKLGYAAVSAIVRSSLASGCSMIDALQNSGVMSRAEAVALARDAARVVP